MLLTNDIRIDYKSVTILFQVNFQAVIKEDRVWKRIKHIDLFLYTINEVHLWRFNKLNISIAQFMKCRITEGGNGNYSI